MILSEENEIYSQKRIYTTLAINFVIAAISVFILQRDDRRFRILGQTMLLFSIVGFVGIIYMYSKRK